jgi:Uma2 family endonuclease
MEVDIIIDELRVARTDAVLLLPADARRQTRAARAAGRRDVKRTRILVPPTLLIESVSPGHEEHDRRVKRRWYAEFGVPKYWILDAFAQTLECLRLKGGRYVRDVHGKGRRIIKPAAFAGLALDPGAVWEDDD